MIILPFLTSLISNANPDPPSVPSVAAPPPAPNATMENMTVQDAPKLLPNAERPMAPMEGKVVAYDPATKMLRVQTAMGDITMDAKAPLPLDTKVLVQIFTDKFRTWANMVILSQLAVQSKEIEKALQPQQQAVQKMREGQTVTALLLPKETPKNAPSSTTPSSPHPSTTPPRVVDPLPEGEGNISSAPPPLPLGDGRGEGTSSPKPELLQKVATAYRPPLSGQPHIPATPESAAPDDHDHSLLEIVTAQIKAKSPPPRTAAPEEMPPLPEQKPAVSPSPVRTVLNTILSLAETIKHPHIPHALAALLHLAPEIPAPKNLYQVTVLKILPPEMPLQEITAATQTALKSEPQALAARVETVTPSGFPVLKTPLGHLVLRTPLEVPEGSTVIIHAAPVPPEKIAALLAPQGMTPAVVPHDFDPLLSPDWPAMQQALQAAQQFAPSVAQTVRHTLPSPTQRLAPTALFFIAALKLGNIENWLGAPALQALQAAGRKDLVEKLGSDFTKLSRQSKETLDGEWKSISMPMLHEEQVSQLQFFVRQQNDRDNARQDGGKPATRFILNLQLSQMGKMQLDGFIQKKQFDLVLRSEEKLPFDIRQELMKRFAQGLDQVQMQGGISFQARNWIHIELPQQKTTLI